MMMSDGRGNRTGGTYTNDDPIGDQSLEGDTHVGMLSLTGSENKASTCAESGSMGGCREL